MSREADGLAQSRKPGCGEGLPGRHDREFGATLQQAGHGIVVLLRQHRASDIGDAPAGAYELGSAVEHGRLFLQPDLEAPRPHAPLGIRVAPPGAGTRAGSVDENEVRLSLEVLHRILPPARRPDLDVPHAGPFEPGMDRSEPPLV